MTEVSGMDVPPRLLTEAFALTRRLVGYHVPARLKALEMYAAPMGSHR